MEWEAYRVLHCSLLHCHFLGIPVVHCIVCSLILVLVIPLWFTVSCHTRSLADTRDDQVAGGIAHDAQQHSPWRMIAGGGIAHDSISSRQHLAHPDFASLRGFRMQEGRRSSSYPVA